MVKRRRTSGAGSTSTDDKKYHCSKNRRWEAMEQHDILVNIFKQYKWQEWCYVPITFICKSWLSAFLDAMFPPGNVLDLNLFEDEECVYAPYTDYGHRNKWKIQRFYHYLKLHLDSRSPYHHYTKVIMSPCLLHYKAYQLIASRLPSVTSFVSPAAIYPGYFKTDPLHHMGGSMFQLWPNLEEARICKTMLWELAGYCKSIRSLTLIGNRSGGIGLPDYIAPTDIAEGFPLLERLDISSHAVSFSGMLIILDGLKNLSYLDIKHTLLYPDSLATFNRWYPLTSDYPWPEDLTRKIANVNTVLTCTGKKCPDCRHHYSR